jgi:hypothetical protein
VKGVGEDEKKALKTQPPSPKFSHPKSTMGPPEKPKTRNIEKNSKIPSHPQLHKTKNITKVFELQTLDWWTMI